MFNEVLKVPGCNNVLVSELGLLDVHFVDLVDEDRFIRLASFFELFWLSNFVPLLNRAVTLI